MNMADCERSERVFFSLGQNDLTSNNAKFFAYPVQSESKYLKRVGGGVLPSTGVNTAVDFSQFAFKALPVFESEGFCLSAHLDMRSPEFETAWGIYTDAFADFECRSRLEQTWVMREPNYRFSAVMHEGAVVGVLACWKLSGFCFVEHVAVSPACRSNGIGQRTLKLLLRHMARPVVVDVEPFGTKRLASRRVAFYARLGFNYCASQVTLPPYAGKTTEPSNLMAWPVVLDGAGRERVYATIRREVYGMHTFMASTRTV